MANLSNSKVSGHSCRYYITRVFLLAKNRAVGGNNPGAFVINTCELSDHISISNKDECDNMDLKRVEKA